MQIAGYVHKPLWLRYLHAESLHCTARAGPTDISYELPGVLCGPGTVESAPGGPCRPGTVKSAPGGSYGPGTLRSAPGGRCLPGIAVITNAFPSTGVVKPVNAMLLGECGTPSNIIRGLA